MGRRLTSLIWLGWLALHLICRFLIEGLKKKEMFRMEDSKSHESLKKMNKAKIMCEPLFQRAQRNRGWFLCLHGYSKRASAAFVDRAFSCDCDRTALLLGDFLKRGVQKKTQKQPSGKSLWFTRPWPHGRGHGLVHMLNSKYISTC